MDKIEWLVIVNPAANNGGGQRFWGKHIAPNLQVSGITYKVVFTKEEGHATLLVINAVEEGYRHFVAVGGDGTYNEVANGILRQQKVPSTDISFGAIAVGTGNDWVKTMQIPTKVEEAIALIKKGETYVQDVGLAHYYKDKKKEQRYFLNVAGTGFDAYISQRLLRGKRFGKMTYFVELALGLLSFKNTPVELKTVDKEVKTKIFTVAVAICKYFGSGMKIAPNAIPNDGLFDITLIKDISKMGVVGQLKNLYNGTFTGHPQVEIFRTKHVKIQSTEAIYLQLDGELVGHGPAEFELIPKALKVVVDNKKMPH